MEEEYKKKACHLRKRMAEVEEENAKIRLRTDRLNHSIRKLRLERALLYNHLASRMKKSGHGKYGGPKAFRNMDAMYGETSDGSSQGPPTVSFYSLCSTCFIASYHGFTILSGNPLLPLPFTYIYLRSATERLLQPDEKPLRSKRAHYRRDLPQEIENSLILAKDFNGPSHVNENTAPNAQANDGSTYGNTGFDHEDDAEMEDGDEEVEEDEHEEVGAHAGGFTAVNN